MNVFSCFPDRRHLTPVFSEDLVLSSRCHLLRPRFWDENSEHIFHVGGTLESARPWLQLPPDCRVRRLDASLGGDVSVKYRNYLCPAERPLPPLSAAIQRLPTRVSDSTLNEHFCHSNVTARAQKIHRGSKRRSRTNPDSLGHPRHQLPTSRAPAFERCVQIAGFTCTIRCTMSTVECEETETTAVIWRLARHQQSTSEQSAVRGCRGRWHGVKETIRARSIKREKEFKAGRR